MDIGPSVQSLSYTHTYESESRKLVDGFRQVTHLGDFHCVLDNGELIARPLGIYETADEARAVLEPYLQGWALRSTLLNGIDLDFRFTGGQVRDGSTRTVSITAVERFGISDHVTAVVSGGRMAVPPGGPLDLGEEVRVLRDRWMDVVEKRERLLVGAYWVLTEIARYYGQRDLAAQELRISRPILSRLGELSSVDDPVHGRKARKAHEPDPRPLIDAEISWIRRCVPILIVRVAEIQSGLDDLEQITMDDLPPLP